MSRRYLSVAETAALIRKALKESFPGVKFSVRSKSYSGGASINVDWTDGPTQQQVESVAKVFSGSYFDGMIDYQGSLYHTLDGEPVSFVADFVFCNRDHSDEAIQQAITDAALVFHSDSIPTVDDFKMGRTFNVSPLVNWQGCGVWSWQDIIHRTLARSGDWCENLSVYPQQESATVARVEYAGSDGYGAAPGVEHPAGYPRL
jgi:hypothetical protein